MTAKEWAEKLQNNARDYSDGKLTADQFDAAQRATWDSICRQPITVHTAVVSILRRAIDEAE